MDSLLDMDKKNLVNLVSLKNEEIKALEEQIKVLKNRIRKRNRSIRRVTTLALERKRKIEVIEDMLKYCSDTFQGYINERVGIQERKQLEHMIEEINKELQ